MFVTFADGVEECAASLFTRQASANASKNSFPKVLPCKFSSPDTAPVSHSAWLALTRGSFGFDLERGESER